MKLEINKYLSISFYKKKINEWNKIGKLKSITVLIISIFPLLLFKYNENKEVLRESYLAFSILIFVFCSLFLPLMSKFWSLLGFEIKKPNWNENPISFNLSQGLNFFQFAGYWFITSGIFKFLFAGIFFQIIDPESVMLFVYGISILYGIKLSLKWLYKK